MAHDKDRVVYSDERITISQAESPDEHDVTVDGKDGAYCFLGRGILKDMARRSDIREFEGSLRAMNYIFLRKLEQINMPIETVAWAFSKARMNELEREVEYFAGRSRNRV